MEDSKCITEIGGYFSLELPFINNNFLHSDAVLLNSGRNALEFILISLLPNIEKIWIPFYTCDSVLNTIKKLKIPFDFYHIDEKLEITNIIHLNKREYIIVNNYFGIKDLYIKKLINQYKENLIIDQTQAWYDILSQNTKAFYSPRKFFGIPDGGIACGIQNKNLEKDLVQDYSWNRFTHLLKRHELLASEGFNEYKYISKELGSEPIKRMSKLTLKLMGMIDMKVVKEKRRKNYELLHNSLKEINNFEVPDINNIECPMTYPLITKIPDMRSILIKNKIYVPTYWPNVLDWCNKTSIEFYLTTNIIPLPIDQRYGVEEMNRIINLIHYWNK